MSSVNKAILIGNLGAAPELRKTAAGLSVCTLRLATNDRVKRGDQWETQTEWHRVVCFGAIADNCNRYLRKGRQVYVEGRIRTNKWTDNDGNGRYTTEIIANTVTFLGAKPQ